MKVTEIMSRPVITVAPDASVKEAARLLIEHKISAVPVVGAEGGLVGIVSEADLVPLETRPDPRGQATPIPPTAGSTPRRVSEVMTRRVVTVPTDAEVSMAARIMIDADVKRLPVMEGARLVGIVSRRDLVKVIARRDEDVQAQLERRLVDAGIDLGPCGPTVTAGVAVLSIRGGDRGKRLAESIALGVPGVLEVRFAS